MVERTGFTRTVQCTDHLHKLSGFLHCLILLLSIKLLANTSIDLSFALLDIFTLLSSPINETKMQSRTLKRKLLAYDFKLE